MVRLRTLLAGSMLVLFANYGLFAQDCTLGMGGRDSELIVRVFQLSSEQQVSMQNWMGELEIYHKDMAEQVRQLFQTHPQQNTEELQELASKYQVLKDKIETTAKDYDRKLLATFSERQYATYMALCREANRVPMAVGTGPPSTVRPE